jgi:hypothetical protein
MRFGARVLYAPAASIEDQMIAFSDWIVLLCVLAQFLWSTPMPGVH